MITASLDATARVWRVDGTGEPIVLRGHDKALRFARLSGDGRLAVTASDDGTVRIWRLDGTAPPVVLVCMGEVWCANFSPDASHVVTVLKNATTQLWSADGHGEPVTLDAFAGALTASYTSDGAHLITGNGMGEVFLWGAEGSSPRRLCRIDRSFIWIARLSPRRDLLLTISTDRDAADDPGSSTSARHLTARLWPTDGHGPPLLLPIPTVIYCAAWISDDERLVRILADDGRIQDWPLDIPGLQDALWRKTPVCLLPSERADLLGEDDATAKERAEACDTRVASL